MDALKITQLYAGYPNRPVLQGIDLTVREGERIGLIGPNGAGKTTLFHSICGLLKPTGGTVELFEKIVRPNQFHPEVGLVFQYPDDQLFSPSVWEDVAFAPINLGLSAEAVEERVKTALELTGTTELKDRAPHQLSGGQKRMVAIAGIQALRPRLIIYDEPSANLDIRSRRRLIRFIEQSAETVMISSHDLELILELCPRVILLDEGKFIAHGNSAEIMGNEPLMEAHGLEKPHSLRPHFDPSHAGMPLVR